MSSRKNEELDKFKKEIENLKKELEEEKKRSKQYLEGWQRTKADYINREREIEKERSNWSEFVIKDLILKILPIYESLNKSLEHKELNDDFLKGIEQIKKQFNSFLKEFGVEKIKTIGEKFDPAFHEVVEKRGDGNEIVEEVSPGYKMNNKVIKVAKVIIQ
ncbi:MAG: nucleotide exchange factor GrpE [Patescibacteria group bacterium]